MMAQPAVSMQYGRKSSEKLQFMIYQTIKKFIPNYFRNLLSANTHMHLHCFNNETQLYNRTFKRSKKRAFNSYYPNTTTVEI
jgi:16S rRNA G527 N7-methylase RsmG